jgi:hypothetical protein
LESCIQRNEREDNKWERYIQRKIGKVNTTKRKRKK